MSRRCGPSRRWLRLLTRTAAGLLIAFLLLVHTPPFEEWMRRRVEKALEERFGGQAQLESLDLRLWAGEVVLEGLAVAPGATETPWRLDVSQLRLGLDLPYFLKLQAVRPELTVYPGRGAGGGLKRSLDGWLEGAHVGTVEVEDGSFKISDRDTDPRQVWIDGLDGRLDRVGRHRFRAEASSGGGRLDLGHRALELNGLVLKLGLREGAIEIEQARVESATSQAELEGRWLVRTPPEAELRGVLTLDGSLAELALPGLGLRGTVKAEGRLDLSGGTHELRLGLASERLMWHGVGPLRASGQLQLLDGVVVPEVKIDAFGGTAELSGALEVDGLQRLETRGQGVELRALAPRAPPSELRFAARVELNEWKLDSARGQAKVELLGAHADPRSVRGTLRLRLAGKRLEIESQDLELGRGTLTFGLSTDQRGDLRGRYELEWADLSELDSLAQHFGLPGLPVKLGGRVAIDGEIGGSWSNPSWKARLESQALELDGEMFALRGNVQGDLGAIEIEELAVSGNGGRLETNGAVPLAPGAHWHLLARVTDLDLATWTRGSLIGKSQGRLEVVGARDTPEWSLGVQTDALGLPGKTTGTGDLKAHGSAREWVVDFLEIALGPGRASARGRLEPRNGDLSASYTIRGLALSDLLPDLPGADRLTGQLHGEGRLGGSLEVPTADAFVEITGLALDGQPLPSLTTTLTGPSPDSTREQEAGLHLRTFDARGQWMTGRTRLLPPFSFELGLDLANLPLETILRAFDARGGWRVEAVQGQASIEGDLRALNQLRYRVELPYWQATTRGTASRATLSAVGTRQLLDLHHFELATEGGTHFEASGQVPFGPARPIDLAASGQLDLGLLEHLSSRLTSGGHASLDLHLTGTGSAPRLAGELRVEDATGSFGSLSWRDFTLVAAGTGQELHVDEARGELLGGTVELEGFLPLGTPAPGSPQTRELVVHLAGVDLAPLLGREEIPCLIVNVDGRLEWPPRQPGALRGAGTFGLESLHLTEQILTGEPGTRWEIGQSGPRRFSTASQRLVGAGTDLEMAARGSFDPTRGLRVALRTRGTADLSLIDSFIDPVLGWQIEGSSDVDLTLHMKSEGESEALGNGLSWHGGGVVYDGRFSMRQPRIEVSDIASQVRLSGQTAFLETFEATMGSGRVEGSGSIELSNFSELGEIDLTIQARGVSLEPVEGIRSVITGSATFRGDAERYRLAGDFELDAGLMTRELESRGADSEFVAQMRWGLSDPEARTLAERIDLDLRLASDGTFRVANQLAQLSAGGQLQLGGTFATPALSGLVIGQDQGLLHLGRHLYDLRAARVELDGYPHAPVAISAEAWTEVGGNAIRLHVEGPADALRTELRSERSDLTQADLASLLLTGRTLSTAPRGLEELASARAASYLNELLESQVGFDLGLTFGNPTSLPILNSETDPESRFTVGRALRENLSVAFSADLSGVENELWIVDYQPRRNLWLRAIQERGSSYTFELAQRSQLELRDRGGSPEPAERPPRIAAVRWDGGALPDAVDPHAALRLKTSQPYRYWRAHDAAERLRSALVELGYLSAAVRFEANPRPDRQVELSFSGETGPRIEIAWAGDDPGEALRREIEEGWEGDTPEAFLVEELRSRLQWQLEARHYFGTEVRVETSGDEDGRRILFDILLGPEGDGVQLDFVGNSRLADGELREALPPATTPSFFALFSGRRSRLDEALAVRYAAEGLLDVRIDGITRHFDPRSGLLTLTVAIDEGPETRVDRILFEGTRALSGERLRRAIELKSGKRFSLPTYLRSRTQLLQTYSEEGFWGTRVQTRATRRGTDMTVTLTVDEGQRATVGAISIRGRVATREGLIRSRLTFAAGDRLRREDLLVSQKRLYDLGVFRLVDLRTEPRPGSAVRDVVVEVTERPDIVMDYGLRYRAETSDQPDPGADPARTDGVELALRAQLIQPFGRAGTLNLSLFPFIDRQVARLSYRRPLFFGLSLPTAIHLDASREPIDPFLIEAEAWDLTFEQKLQLSERARLQWSYQFGNIRFEPGQEERDAILGLRASSRRARLSTSLIHDHRDSITQPTRGRLWIATAQYGSAALGSEFDFVRLYGQLSAHLPFGSPERPWVWATGVRLGAVLSSDPFLFLKDRFTAGGPYSVRGFPISRLGPLDPETGAPVGGQALAIFNQELRFPLYRSLRGALFLDAGNVFLEAEDLALDELRHSVGLGLRANLPFGVLRLDWARRLAAEPGERSSRWHFALGHAF